MSDTEECEETPCDHHWTFVRDWYGDPTIPYGTADCSFYRCKRCGEEQTERPDDYEDPAELDADHWRDLRESFASAKKVSK